MRTLVAIAGELRRPITELSAVILPLSQGAQDSHGRLVASEAEMRDRLLNRLTAARAAIETAILAVATKERTESALRARDSISR
jgi:hypothetical protein